MAAPPRDTPQAPAACLDGRSALRNLDGVSQPRSDEPAASAVGSGATVVPLAGSAPASAPRPSPDPALQKESRAQEERVRVRSESSGEDAEGPKRGRRGPRSGGGGGGSVDKKKPWWMI